MLHLKLKNSISEFYSHGKNQWLDILEPGEIILIICLSNMKLRLSGIPETFV